MSTACVKIDTDVADGKGFDAEGMQVVHCSPWHVGEDPPCCRRNAERYLPVSGLV